MSKEKTVELSRMLKKVYKDEAKIDECVDYTANEIKEVINHKNEVAASGVIGVGKCPVCGGTMRSLAWGYGCSNYKDGCTFAINRKIANKIVPETQVIKLLENGITDTIKDFKSKEGREFSAKLKIEDGKVAFDFFVPKTTKLPCPCCQNSLTDEKWAWKCSCGFSINHEIAGVKINENYLSELSADGVTSSINGFKSKTGKVFAAKLKLNKETRKVDFLFM